MAAPLSRRSPAARQGQWRLRFEATSDVSAYTKGAVFQPGMTTESVIRFSTFAGAATR
jgi:catalase